MTTRAAQTWLAFDIGGANLKAAHSDGSASSRSFQLWKRPDDLADALIDLAEGLSPADGWAVTMTAELCDCFATKADGVRSILAATERAAAGRPVQVWGTDGQFHAVGAIRDHPRLAAASNWLALASVVARSDFGASGLLIDVGSTTTDLVPWRDGSVALAPTFPPTDLGRLQAGALVYAGVRRTPLCALGSAFEFRGVTTPIMAELFATTADVYLTLGNLAVDPFDLATGDGRPLTWEASRDRLARMVGLDRDDFTPEDARVLAVAVDRSLLDRLTRAVDLLVASSLGEPPPAIVIAGAGEFLARKLAERVVAPGGSIHSLAASWGREASSAACAHALIHLLAAETPA